MPDRKWSGVFGMGEDGWMVAAHVDWTGGEHTVVTIVDESSELRARVWVPNAVGNEANEARMLSQVPTVVHDALQTVMDLGLLDEAGAS